MQRVETVSRYCPQCERQTRHDRHVTAMGGGDLVLAIATLGVWLVFRVLYKPEFRCVRCGR
jgi:hypothetical protein